jgi:integrase
MLDHFGENAYFDEIDDAGVNDLVHSWNCAPATINRKLGVLGAIVNRAKEKWGVEVPDVQVKRHLKLAPEPRTRWITVEEADRLIMAAAPHLKPIIKCALLTGLRLGNIYSLRWEQVDFKKKEINIRVKSKLPGRKLLTLPISDTMLNLLLEQEPKESGHVFLRRFKNTKGQGLEPVPMKGYKHSFRRACKVAGITDFHFHDLRHTAASWMIQNGVPLDVVQLILGHFHISQTQKYAHRDSRAKLDALNVLAV